MGDLAGVPGTTVAGAAVLLAVLAYAAREDLRVREVGDAVWVVGAVIGGAIGLVALVGGGGWEIVSWLLVAGLVLEHLVPWDVVLERRAAWLPGVLETVGYVAVGLFLAAGAVVLGTGAAGISVASIAAYISVLAARSLFEFGVLYGGADAKAVMVAGLLVPLDTTPVLSPPPSAVTLLAYYPFTLTLLMDAAVVAAVVPLALTVRSVGDGSFEFPRSFTSYRIPVVDLPHRYVWLRDPMVDGADEDEASTTEEDQALRQRQADALAARGVTEAWVTPQLPFIVFLAIGAALAIGVGNLLFDLFAVA